MLKVAVVMAAYNSEATIRQAVESVLSSKVSCRVFVVDDNSRQPIAPLLADLSDRVVLLRTSQNVGPAAARNMALDIILKSEFDYVAVMDADDISELDRIDKQVEFLESRPQLGACGSFLREFHEKSGETIRIFERPIESSEVRKVMFFNMGINHASTMFRAEVLRDVGTYSLQYKAAEDYELMRRINAKYDLANVPECLVHYRVSSKGQSHRLRKRQVMERIQVQLKYFDFFEWRAWAGITRSLLAILAPPRVLQSAEAARAAGSNSSIAQS